MRATCALSIVAVLSICAPAAADTATPAPPTVAAPDPRCPTATLEAATASAKKRVAQVVALANTFDQLAGQPEADDGCRVALYQIYRKFYDDVQVAMEERSSMVDRRIEARLEREIAVVGWKDNGDYIQTNSDWLLKRVGARLPADWREYLALDTRDEIEGFTSDGGLVIKWSTLRGRILRWERFEARHPGFALAEKIRKNTRVLLGSLLAGMDSSPAFGAQDRMFVPEVKAQIEAYVRASKAPQGPLVHGYLALIEQHDGHFSDEARAYLEKNELTPGDDYEPRGYRQPE